MSRRRSCESGGGDAKLVPKAAYGTTVMGYVMKNRLMAGACALALCLAAGQVDARAQHRKALKCADPAEVTAMQSAAVQQELMDAALTCGDEARTNFNAFQTSFGPELRRSDRVMLDMFHRVLGFRKGDDAYNLFKTDMASKAELRRVHGHEDFCTAANLVISAALSPNKPSLADFVGQVPVTDMESPVDNCSIEVAVTLQGAMALPNIVPTPNPLRLAALTPPPEPSPLAPGNSSAPAAPDIAPAPTPPAQEPAAEKPKEKSGWLSGLWN